MTAPRRRPPPTFHEVTVAAVHRPTPGTVRITFTGESLTGYPADGPAAHFKLLLPPPGHDRVSAPPVTADGVAWPEGDARPILRTYTPRRVDTVARQVDVDFAVHADGGPATRWAERARPGDQVVLTGARGPYQPDTAADWLLLAGDESALPAIATILAAAPAGLATRAFLELADPADRIELPGEVRWLQREPGRDAGLALADAVAADSFPPGIGRFWIATEASAMRRIRRHLIAERGVARDALFTRGYWKYGASNHPDHDTGEDAD